jgi:hypothetical protein
MELVDEKLVWMGSELGGTEFIFVTAKFSKRHGVELHLLSDRASPGQILVYGCEQEPDSTELEDHRLSFFQLSIEDCSTGKETLKESDARTTGILERYLQHRAACNLKEPQVQYVSQDTEALRSIREALPAPRMVQ